MLLGYKTPITDSATGITWSATVDTSVAYLKDGRPGGLCQLTTSGTSTLTASFAHNPITVRCAALINISLDVGTTITATLKQTTTGYSVGATTADVVLTASGDKCVFFTWGGVTDVDGIQFSIPDEGQFTLGEIWVSDALTDCIRSSWAVGTSGIARDVSISGALYVSPSVARRTVSAEYAPRDYDVDFAKYQQAVVDLSNNPRVLIAFDDATQSAVEQTGMYARAISVGNLTGDSNGRYFALSLTAEEMPGRAV